MDLVSARMGTCPLKNLMISISKRNKSIIELNINFWLTFVFPETNLSYITPKSYF